MSSEKVKKPREPRKKVTLESHIEKCDKLIELLDAEIEKKQKEREPGVRIFRTIRKNLKEIKNEAPKIAKTKRRFNSNSKRVSGLADLKCEITEELADFMGLEHGENPTRNEITNAICVYIRLKPDESRPQMLKWAHLNPEGKRNLQDPSSGMKIVPDEKLSNLLKYDEYVDKVNKGEITKTKTDKETKKRNTVVVKDNSLEYWVLQKLIPCQIIKTIGSQKENNEQPKDED